MVKNLYFSYKYLILNLYRIKSNANRLNANVLETIFLLIFIHALVIVIDFILAINLGFIEYWSGNGSKSVFTGYIIGFIIFGGVEYIKRGRDYLKDEFKEFQLENIKKIKKIYSYLFLLFIVFFISHIYYFNNI